MRRIFSFAILAVSFLPVLLLAGCEKKEGKIYLCLVNSIKAKSDIVVRDSKGEIPLDGDYHEVSGYLETEYKLYDVVWDSVTNWTTNCILEQVWLTNRTVNKYFGDFEKLPDDSYYTLTLKYKIDYSDPKDYSWLDDFSYQVSNIRATYYNIVFTYSDNSILSSSPAP